MSTEADVAAVLDTKAAAVFSKRWAQLRRDVLEVLEEWGADTPQQKQQAVTELLAGSDAVAAALSLPWAIAASRARLVDRLRDSYLEG